MNEVVNETKLNSEISFPTDSCLAQSVQHWTDDREVVSSIPNGGNILFCSSPLMLAGFWKDLAGNNELQLYRKTRLSA